MLQVLPFALQFKSLGLPIWCLEKVLWKCHDLCSSIAKANVELLEGPFTQWFDGNKALATEVWEKIIFSF